MEEDSTTVVGNSEDTQANESITTTEQQTADTSDNLDTSTSTDTSAADDTSTTSTDDGSSTATQFDADIDEWAAKTNRPVPTTDAERAYLQEIRDGQREYTRAKQAKEVSGQLDKSLKDIKPADDTSNEDYIDPLEQRLNATEARLAESEALRQRSEYVTEKGVTMEETNVMKEILEEKVAKGGKAAFDYWTDPANLEDWHTLAKARMATSADTSEIEQQAIQRERERIARESKANGPVRNASSTQTATKTAEQARLERFSNWD